MEFRLLLQCCVAGVWREMSCLCSLPVKVSSCDPFHSLRTHRRRSDALKSVNVKDSFVRRPGIPWVVHFPFPAILILGTPLSKLGGKRSPGSPSLPICLHFVFIPNLILSRRPRTPVGRNQLMRSGSARVACSKKLLDFVSVSSKTLRAPS